MSKLRPISPQPSSKPKPKETSSTASPLVEKLRLEPLRPTWTQASHRPLSTRLRTSSPRARSGLVVDIENKPGTYGPGDYTHPKITAVGWGWVQKGHPRKPHTVGRTLQRDDPAGMVSVAEELRGIWERADFIVGHNFRRHDRKILDGWYMALGLPLLAPKRIVDTYLDQPKLQGLSRSLENQSARWGCPISKPHLEEHVWEAAYDGVPWAVDVMNRRVQADVAINRWLYLELVRRGYL